MDCDFRYSTNALGFVPSSLDVVLDNEQAADIYAEHHGYQPSHHHHHLLGQHQFQTPAFSTSSYGVTSSNKHQLPHPHSHSELGFWEQTRASMPSPLQLQLLQQQGGDMALNDDYTTRWTQQHQHQHQHQHPHSHSHSHQRTHQDFLKSHEDTKPISPFSPLPHSPLESPYPYLDPTHIPLHPTLISSPYQDQLPDVILDRESESYIHSPGSNTDISSYTNDHHSLSRWNTASAVAQEEFATTTTTGVDQRRSGSRNDTRSLTSLDRESLGHEYPMDPLVRRCSPDGYSQLSSTDSLNFNNGNTNNNNLEMSSQLQLRPDASSHYGYDASSSSERDWTISTARNVDMDMGNTQCVMPSLLVSQSQSTTGVGEDEYDSAGLHRHHHRHHHLYSLDERDENGNVAAAASPTSSYCTALSATSPATPYSLAQLPPSSTTGPPNSTTSSPKQTHTHTISPTSPARGMGMSIPKSPMAEMGFVRSSMGTPHSLPHPGGPNKEFDSQTLSPASMLAGSRNFTTPAGVPIPNSTSNSASGYISPGAAASQGTYHNTNDGVKPPPGVRGTVYHHHPHHNAHTYPTEPPPSYFQLPIKPPSGPCSSSPCSSSSLTVIQPPQSRSGPSNNGSPTDSYSSSSGSNRDTTVPPPSISTSSTTTTTSSNMNTNTNTNTSTTPLPLPPPTPNNTTVNHHHGPGQSDKKRGKQKQPHIACLFCRRRKIACVPGPSGNKDVGPCMPCSKRELQCVRPTVNRRGHRKKGISPSVPEGFTSTLLAQNPVDGSSSSSSSDEDASIA